MEHSEEFFNQISLHSTMFLLILRRPALLDGRRTTLHSTMFLLIPSYHLHQTCRHYSLHSTMFLLILMLIKTDIIHSVIFTFHNVSINTDIFSWRSIRFLPLHSTMFLLIQRTLQHR